MGSGSGKGGRGGEGGDGYHFGCAQSLIIIVIFFVIFSDSPVNVSLFVKHV